MVEAGMVAEYLGWVCIGLGVFFAFSAAVGLVRMPDFFTRLHPSGVSDSMAVILVTVGLMLHFATGLVTLKLLLLALFSLITSATACHALAKAAVISDGIPPSGKKRRA